MGKRGIKGRKGRGEIEWAQGKKGKGRVESKVVDRDGILKLDSPLGQREGNRQLSGQNR